MSFLLLFLLLLLAGWGLSMLRHGCHRFATASFVAALLVFGLFVFKHQQLQSSANRETLIVLAQESEKAMDVWREQREALYAKAATVDVKLGAEDLRRALQRLPPLRPEAGGAALLRSAPQVQGRSG